MDVAILTALVVLSVILLWDLHKRQDNPVQDAQDTAVNELAQRVVLDLGEKLDSLKEFDQLATKRAELEVELSNLKREKDEIERGFSQKQQAMEHTAGLLRTQLDAELEQERVKSGLDADRKILDAEKRFSEETMEAKRKSFEEQLKRTDEITERLFRLVPNIEARLRIKGSLDA